MSAVLVALGFALSGMLTGGLMQADVVSYEGAFDLNHEQVSFWLSLFSVLTAIGGVAGGVMADRWGAAHVYRGCIAASGAGLGAFYWIHPVTTLGGFCVAGLGVGGLVVGNILVAQDESSQPNRSLNLLHAAHGLARFLGVFVSVYAVGAGWQKSYLLLGVAFLILGIVYRLAGDPPGGVKTARQPLANVELPVAAVGMGFAMYMFAEMVLITWLPAYFEQERLWSPAESRSAYAVFLAGLILGRWIAARRWPVELPAPVCRNLALCHAALLAAFLSVDAAWAAWPILFAAGCCEGPGWPSLFAFAIRRATGAEGRLTSVIYVVCCAAIVVSTAGSGMLAQRMGIESTFYVVGIAHAIFSVIFFRLLQQHRKSLGG